MAEIRDDLAFRASLVAGMSQALAFTLFGLLDAAAPDDRQGVLDAWIDATDRLMVQGEQSTSGQHQRGLAAAIEARNRVAADVAEAFGLVSRSGDRAH